MPIPKNSDRKKLVDGLAQNDHILFAVETV